MQRNVLIEEDGRPIQNKHFTSFESRDIKVNIVENSQIINFVGFIFSKNNILVSFPKNYSVTNVSQDIGLLYKTLSKSISKNTNLSILSNENLLTNYPFNDFYEIYSYFQKFGLYYEEDNITKDGYSGKINWKKTISNSPKILTRNGIVYAPFKINQNKKNDSFITDVMAYAIDYTLDYFSNIMKLKYSSRNTLPNNFISKTPLVLSKLRNQKRLTFKDRDKKLLDSLINFYSNINEGGVYYLKHYSFSSVWEKMIEDYLNNYFRSADQQNFYLSTTPIMRKNKFQKEVFYPNAQNPIESIQPDHYLIENDKQYIFDSKYYQSSMGMNYKQMIYHLFLSNYVYNMYPNQDIETISALILPGNPKYYKAFESDKKFKKYNDDSLIVNEVYVDYKLAMNNYINN